MTARVRAFEVLGLAVVFAASGCAGRPRTPDAWDGRVAVPLELTDEQRIAAPASAVRDALMTELKARGYSLIAPSGPFAVVTAEKIVFSGGGCIDRAGPAERCGTDWGCVSTAQMVGVAIEVVEAGPEVRARLFRRAYEEHDPNDAACEPKFGAMNESEAFFAVRELGPPRRGRPRTTILEAVRSRVASKP